MLLLVLPTANKCLQYLLLRPSRVCRCSAVQLWRNTARCFRCFMVMVFNVCLCVCVTARMGRGEG